MKNKTKLLVGAVALLTATGAGLGSATYAWFTTTRTATVSTDPITVINGEGALAVALKTNDVYEDTVTGSAHVISLKDAQTGLQTRDVSGDGANLYTPAWINEGVNANSISASLANTEFVEYTLIISNTGSKSIDVRLSVGTQIEANSAEADDVAAASAARVALVDGTTVKSLFTQVEAAADASYDYITADAGQTLYNVEGYKKVGAAATLPTVFNNAAFTNLATSSISDDNQLNPLICTLAATGSEGSSKEIIVRSWVEGEDPDCVNAAVSGQYKFTLDFRAI